MQEKYTLAEARQVIAEQDCARHGHELSQLHTLGGDTVSIFCDRCGLRWVPAEPLTIIKKGK